jgi:hypothetical protein
MWRQGDIFIEAIESIPKDAAERSDLVLAEGAVTGHRHEVAPVPGVQLLERLGTLYLAIEGERAVIVHPEHRSILLKTGTYRVWRQREYTGELAPRFVMD